MKRALYLSAAVILALAAQATAQKGGAKRELDFQRCESYFEKNNSGLKGQKSYLALVDQKQFDKVFGPAATMGQNSFLPPGAFKSKIVVAAIKRGSLRHYDGVKVTAGGGVLTVSYTAKDDPPGSATFSSPLILAVDRGRYREVVFVENGARAGAVRVRR